MAKKIALRSGNGWMIFKSPPNIIPFFSIADALEISSALSPEAGTTTSFPELYIVLSLTLAKVSTFSIFVL